MGESQSRYSIIEALCVKKLKIMDKLVDLKNEIENKKIELDRKEQEFTSWNTRVEESRKAEESEKLTEISIMKKEIEYLESGIEEKKTSYQNKIKELDKALEAIAEISKASVEQSIK